VSLVLARIDQRLVHGQVVLGWLPEVSPDRVLVVDDDLAADAWEADLVVSSVPPGIEAEVRTVAQGAEILEREGERPGRLLLLVRTPATLRALFRAGVALEEANLGGLHYRDGTRRILEYVHVTAEDLEALADLAREGVRVVARDVPASPARDLTADLTEGRLAFDRLPVRRS
jgi:mannose/fructose/N-acetylgalactosamine-specific phosphotransferase system component IIB